MCPPQRLQAPPQRQGPGSHLSSQGRGPGSWDPTSGSGVATRLQLPSPVSGRGPGSCPKDEAQPPGTLLQPLGEVLALVPKTGPSLQGPSSSFCRGVLVPGSGAGSRLAGASPGPGEAQGGRGTPGLHARGRAGQQRRPGLGDPAGSHAYKTSAAPLSCGRPPISPLQPVTRRARGCHWPPALSGRSRLAGPGAVGASRARQLQRWSVPFTSRGPRRQSGRAAPPRPPAHAGSSRLARRRSAGWRLGSARQVFLNFAATSRLLRRSPGRWQLYCRGPSLAAARRARAPCASPIRPAAARPQPASCALPLRALCQPPAPGRCAPSTLLMRPPHALPKAGTLRAAAPGPAGSKGESGPPHG
ncbi:uncharacterized protein LOC142015977 [Carettochelys insculpta]|uniref:uncharacterized protein LOC142015977 n=1 Tax=Carettochelys insculpta TaxID=44489 RepID=UPI003EBB0061